MKRRTRSKTYQFAVALSALGALQVAMPSVQDAFDKRDYAIFMIVVGVLVAVLREMTNEGVGGKD